MMMLHINSDDTVSDYSVTTYTLWREGDRVEHI